MTCIPMSPARFRVRELVEEAGISQSQLAKDADVSFATVNRLCQNATAQVSLETLDKIAQALSVTLDRTIEPGELIEREGKRRGRGK